MPQLMQFKIATYWQSFYEPSNDGTIEIHVVIMWFNHNIFAHMNYMNICLFIFESYPYTF